MGEEKSATQHKDDAVVYLRKAYDSLIKAVGENDKFQYKLYIRIAMLEMCKEILAMLGHEALR